MYVKSFAAIVASLLVLSWGAFSQCSNQSLTTTFAGGNAQNGNMFDIVCTDPTGVLIQSFEGNWTGTGDISIYTHSGSINGTETNPSAWTLIGSAPGVVGNGFGAATPIPIAVNQLIGFGNTQAFYITRTAYGTLYYTNGTLQGNVFASDASIQFLEGTGNVFPFGTVYTPRVWNGNICYTTGAASFYETNGPAAALDVDGVIGSGQNLAQVNKNAGSWCTPPDTATLNFSGPAGQLYDVLMSPTSIVPVGFSAPPSTEIINLAIWAGLGPSLNGGNPFTPTLLPSGFLVSGTATISVVFTTTTAQTVGMQGFCTNATLPGGYELTQPVELNITNGPATSAPGPTLDDQTIAYNITAAPTNWMPSGFNFYGTNYTTIVVDSNGRVEFGSGTSDFTPTTAEALSGSPMVGVWADFAPNMGGAITLHSCSQGSIRVDFVGVAYYNNPASSSSFAIALGPGSSFVYLMNLTGLDMAQPTSGDVFMGLSAGSVGTTAGPTTDPMVNTLFDTSFGWSIGPALPTDMIYDMGIGALPASINPPQSLPLDNLLFFPDPAGIGYLWNASF